MGIPLPFKPKTVSEQGTTAVFEIEGLYPGYGQTVGNSLRRVLLSSLEGAVITSVRIAGVGHEFSTIEGVKEDMVDLILNLKQMRFRVHGEGPVIITLSAKGEREVTGADFQASSQVDVITKDVHIASLTSKKSIFEMEATVEIGVGYVPTEARSKEKVSIGDISLDASFSPVRHVNYEVHDMRVADRTDYNRLRLAVGTDGSLTPREAIQRALEILVAQFSELVAGSKEVSAVADGAHRDLAETHTRAEELPEEKPEEDVLKTRLDPLKISSRTLNALREAGVKTVGGAARKREETLREIEGLGDKAIAEIKKELGNSGLR